MSKFFDDNKYFILLLAFLSLSVYFIAKYITNQKRFSEEVISKKSDSIRTVIVEKDKLVYLDRYKPQLIHDTIKKEVLIKVPVEHQPVGTNEEIQAKLHDLAMKHYKTYHYSDSIKLRDSLNRDAGYVTINDKVSENKIDREVSYQLMRHKEIVTITNTITVKEPKKRHLAIGVEASYDRKIPYTSTGAGLMYSDKKGNHFQATTGVTVQTATYYFRVGYFKTL